MILSGLLSNPLQTVFQHIQYVIINCAHRKGRETSDGKSSGSGRKRQRQRSEVRGQGKSSSKKGKGIPSVRGQRSEAREKKNRET